MGAFIWHQWAHFVSVTASIYTVWASFWAFTYRKFFWDFVHGIVRAPGGVQPANSDKIFIQLIVQAPVIPIIAMIFGFMNLMLELPYSPLKNLNIFRSFVVHIVLLLAQAFLTILFYQGTNASIYSLIAVVGYTAAQLRDEIVATAKDNKGRVGSA
jgi:hypothetical protein